MSLFIYAIDTNIGFTEDVYYLKFKDIHYLKYVPGHKQGRQDGLILLSNNSNINENYLLITELLSALSFGLDARFMAASRGRLEGTHTFTDLIRSNNSSPYTRRIVAERSQEDFIFVPPLDGEKEIALARLYRIANSSDDLYLKILFFWHCLCYTEGENSAVSLLNGIEAKIPPEIELSPVTLESVKENPIMLKEKKTYSNLGKYMKDGVRHSIAHIKRTSTLDQKSFELDNLEELSHLNEILEILKGAAKYMMEYVLGMKKADSLSYLKEIPPEDVGK